MIKKLKLTASLTNNNTNLFDLFNDPIWNFNPQFFRLLKPTKNTITKFNDPENIEQQLTILTITLVYNHVKSNNTNGITDLDLITMIQHELTTFININQLTPNITIEKFTNRLLHPKDGEIYTTGLLYWNPTISQIINHKEAHEIHITSDFTDFITYIDTLINNRSRNTNADTANSIHTCYSRVHNYAQAHMNNHQPIYNTLFSGLHQDIQQISTNMNTQSTKGNDLLRDLQKQDITLNHAYEIINKQFNDYANAIMELNKQHELKDIKHDLTIIFDQIKHDNILSHICDEFLKTEYAQSFDTSSNNIFWNSLSTDAHTIIRQYSQKTSSIMHKLNDNDQAIIKNQIIKQFTQFQNYFNVNLPQQLNHLHQISTTQMEQFNKIYNTFLSSHRNHELNDLLTQLTVKFANVSNQIQDAIIDSITTTTNSLPIDHQTQLINDDSFTTPKKHQTKITTLPKNTPEQDLTDVHEIHANNNVSNPYTISKITEHLKNTYHDTDCILLSDHLDDFDMLEHASLMSSYADFPYQVHILNSLIEHENLMTHDLLFTKATVKYERSSH